MLKYKDIHHTITILPIPTAHTRTRTHTKISIFYVYHKSDLITIFYLIVFVPAVVNQYYLFAQQSFLLTPLVGTPIVNHPPS